jgi:GDP-L-fucose synthase
MVALRLLPTRDLADACVFVMKHYSASEFLNAGTGQDITIAEFGRLVADGVGYRGQLIFDTSRPDGPPRKLLDVSKLEYFGRRAKTWLRDGIAVAYADFLAGGADVVDLFTRAINTKGGLSLVRVNWSH